MSKSQSIKTNSRKKDNSSKNERIDSNEHEAFERIEKAELTKLSKNLIRQVKRKFIRDTTFLRGVLSTAKERKVNFLNSQSGFNPHSGTVASEKIQAFEEEMKRKLFDEYIKKTNRKNEVFKNYQSMKQSQLELRKKQNEKNQEKTKKYFLNYAQEHENDYLNYLKRDIDVSNKVEKALNKKREEINSIIKYQNIKLIKAKNKHEGYLIEKDKIAAIEYLENKEEMIDRYYGLNRVKPVYLENHLDKLKKTGKLDCIQSAYINKHNSLVKNLTNKYYRKEEYIENNRRSKIKRQMSISMHLESNKAQTERNRRILQLRKEKEIKKLKEKTNIISNRLELEKESQDRFIQLRKKFERLRSAVKEKFDEIMISKKNMSVNHLRSLLYSIIPQEEVNRAEIEKEINNACLAIDECNKSDKGIRKNRNMGEGMEYLDKSHENITKYSNEKMSNNNNDINYSNSNFNVYKNVITGEKEKVSSNYQNKTNSKDKLNTNITSKKQTNSDSKNAKTYLKKLSLEILEMISKEKERENERQRLIDGQDDLKKIKDINSVFTKERLEFSEMLLEKQR